MNKHLIYLGFAAIIGFAGVVSAGTYSGGGNGTAEKPYRIATAADMNEIGANTEDWGSHFVMVNDINLADYTGSQFNIIGNGYTLFTGVFDGNEHTISNFTYTATHTSSIGLFGYVYDANAVIKDLTLVAPDVNATGKSWYVGCLVSYLGSGTITGCGVEVGSVSGTSCTGGLVGENYDGTVSNCYASTSVTGGVSIGELVGSNSGTIENCYAEGSVTGNYTTGGLVGENEYGTISNCYSSGSVSGNGDIGGLVGYNYYGTISNCYAAGSVSGTTYTGGLVGDNHGTILNSYSIASVMGDDHTGGLVGSGAVAVNCFWDIETSGQSQSASGTGKTTAEMKTASTFFGWGGCGNEGVWTIDEDNDYPRLSWQNLPGQPLAVQQLCDFVTGSGTEVNPYRIYTAEELNLVGLFICEWDKHFILMADVNLASYTGTEFNIIGSAATPFTGVFDGNGHAISNFTYETADAENIGLFSYVDDANAVIKDLTSIAPDVNAAGDSENVGSLVGRLVSGTISGCGVDGGSVTGCYSTGGLVGDNDYGMISNCYSIGDVTGDEFTSGLVGWNSSGTIENCYTITSVSGEDYTGGLVGYNFRGTILNSYMTGSVTGGDCTGGLVGYNTHSTISNCYATGSATGSYRTGGLVGHNWYGTISDCYATGSVTGASRYTGGLVGHNSHGSISNCYAVGEVSASGTSWQSGYYYEKYENVVVNGMGYYCLENHTSSSSFEDDLAAGYWRLTTGGLVGYGYQDTISASFWDVNSSGQDISYGGQPKTTVQMQTKSTFTDAGWDFVGESINGPNDIWRLCEDGTDYPRLAWQMIMLGDFVCGDGVDFNDLDVFMQQWLMEKLSADVAVGGGDGVVDFLDWAVLADGWQNTIDINDVADFAEQWLQFGAYCADIAPSPGGDGIVDFRDWAVLADNWLEGL